MHTPTTVDIARAFGLAAIPDSWLKMLSSGRAAPEDGVIDVDVVRRQAEWLEISPDVCAGIVEVAATICSSPVLRVAAAIVRRLLFDLPFESAPGADAFPMPAPDPSCPALALFYAPLFLERVPALQELHRRLELPEEWTRELLLDIPTWIEEHRRRNGTPGLSEIRWLRLHFHGQLFQIGRLQYQPATFSLPFRVFQRKSLRESVALVEDGQQIREDGQFVDADITSRYQCTGDTSRGVWNASLNEKGDQISGYPVTLDGAIDSEPTVLLRAEYPVVVVGGSPVLNVHIPARGPLDADAVAASFAEAGSYFADRSVTAKYSAYVCTSWLLDPQLQSYLPTDSNIVRFQRFFRLLPVPGADDHQHIQRILPNGVPDAPGFGRLSALQRAFLEHVHNGGTWRMAAGIRPV